MNPTAVKSGPIDISAPGARPLASEIPEGLAWVNSDTPVRIGDLRGRLVLLDFWSGSGIHCADHVRDINALQRRFGESMTVLAVHVPKFEHERNERAAQQAIARLQVRHAVLHDPGFVLWQHYAIQSWPTTVVIDAEGRVAARIAGCGTRDALTSVIEQLLEEAAKLDLRAYADASEYRIPEPRMTLSFPARVAANERHLYVADSGHHRVLECGHDGRILRTFGNGNPDFLDGNGHEASMRHPQGLALSHDTLYVADTGNHAIRAIRLMSGEVETLAGNGQRGLVPQRRIGSPRDTPLNAPVDIALHHDHLYIAMTGCHQIWRLDLGDSTLAVLAGSGRLGAGDGSPLAASLAQPSGLAVLGKRLYFSDADGSALRGVCLDDAPEVRTLVGAGLFVFGDADGHRADARLQFPQGLCADARNRQIYIADAYNDKIRSLQVNSLELRTLPLSYRLHEPSGVALAAGALWIANSGAHEVVRYDLAKGTTSRIAVGG
jgi:hypothetical protein